MQKLKNNEARPKFTCSNKNKKGVYTLLYFRFLLFLPTYLEIKILFSLLIVLLL